MTHPFSTLILGVFPLDQIAHVQVSLSRKIKLMSPEIIFKVLQRVWKTYLNVTYRQRDGRTTYCGITAVCAASCNNNTLEANTLNADNNTVHSVQKSTQKVCNTLPVLSVAVAVAVTGWTWWAAGNDLGGNFCASSVSSISTRCRWNTELGSSFRFFFSFRFAVSMSTHSWITTEENRYTHSWLGSVEVGHHTCDQQVASLTPAMQYLDGWPIACG